MIQKTKSFEPIINYLKKDLIVNLNIIGIMENEKNAEVYTDNTNTPSGVFVRNGYFNYIYTQNDAFLEEVINTMFTEGSYCFSGVHKPIAEKIKKKFDIEWENKCTLYYLPEENLNTELIKNNVASIRIDDAEIIDSFYTFRNKWSLEAIKDDISHRPSSAIYIDNDIVCWVLVHNDNSMGIMYTKEEYRNKGYAVDVSTDLAAKILKSKKIPYLQIVDENKMSPGLAKKCGFIEYAKVVWFGIDLSKKLKQEQK